MTLMLEEQVNDLHRERWASAVAQYGSTFAVPGPVAMQLAEANRQDWLAFYEQGEGDPNRPRKDKTQRMLAYVAENVGQVITPAMLVDAAESAIGTAYGFIDAHRSLFRKVGTGQYLVLDTDAERAAAKRAATGATLPRAGSDGGTVADHEADIVNAALDRMTGAAPRPVGGVGKL